MYSEMTIWEKSIVFIGFIAFLTTLMFGHQNVIVAIYGCLPFWFGMPLCYIIGKKLHADDVAFILKLILSFNFINSFIGYSLILEYDL